MRIELKCCIISNIGVYIPQWRDVDAIKCGRITHEEFRNRYISKVLSDLNPAEIYTKYNGLYLLCCEKDPQHCHRTILADWLSMAGYDVKEGIF